MSTEAPNKPVYNLKNPFIAHLKEARDLTTPDAVKNTRHYELDLAGSGMEYLPGDSLAVLATNDPALVDDTLKALGFSGEEPVTNPRGAQVSVRQALTESFSITEVDMKLMKAIADKSAGASPLTDLILPEMKEPLKNYLWGRFVIDLLQDNDGVKFEPTEFVGLLKKLNVRLYSISSSLKAHPEEVHLTVATVTYESHGRVRGGVCSTFLARRIDPTTPIPVFITPGKGFRLPEPHEETPIILCGPGTGIAPFRAFLEERKATAAKGKAWLLFGETSERTSFFYKAQFEGYLTDGTLARLDCAWSRDQAEKVYVQHKILENSRQFWDWLEQGAIFYVCGDASRMAVDVDKALHQIIEKEGGKSATEAEAYVEEMRKAKRYRRDVY